MLSIIIPALNEESKIVRDLDAATSFLSSYNLSGEVIVVADGSTDKTAVIASVYARYSPHVVRMLPQTMQLGKGAAIKRGVEAAKGDVIMFADAGLCVPYEDAVAGLMMLQYADIALGSRSLPGTVLIKRQPLWRQVGSRLFRSLLYTLMGLPRQIGDTQCGFKLYRADVARVLFAELATPGYMFDIEIILRAVAHGLRVAQFPVRWTNDADSRFSPWAGSIAVARALLRLRHLGRRRSAQFQAPNPETRFA